MRNRVAILRLCLLVLHAAYNLVQLTGQVSSIEKRRCHENDYI